jgi:hypothetical protein
MMNAMMDRTGGMMGFRPVGMLGQGAAEGGGVTDAVRAEIIKKLMSMTGMQANSFASMSTEKLSEALMNLQDRFQAQVNEEVIPLPDNLKIFELMDRQRQPMPMPMPTQPTQPTPESPLSIMSLAPSLGSSVTGSPGYDPATNTYTPPLPEGNQRYYPEMMAGGGIMSLRGY